MYNLRNAIVTFMLSLMHFCNKNFVGFNSWLKSNTVCNEWKKINVANHENDEHWKPFKFRTKKKKENKDNYVTGMQARMPT